METWLVENAKRGDGQAFASLWTGAARKVRATLSRKMPEQELLEEAEQRTMILSWRKLYQFNGKSTFSSWACAIALNELRQLWRDGSKTLETVGIEQAFSIPDIPAARHVERLHASKVLSLIDARLRRAHRGITYMAFVAHFSGMVEHEAQSWLGVPIATYKSRLHRARVAISKIIMRARQ